MTTSDTAIVLEPSDWYVTHTVRLNESQHTLRVRLRRNAYDHQSTAIMESYNPTDMRWITLHVLHPSQWVGDVPTVAAVRIGKSTAQDVEEAGMIVVAEMLGYASRLLGIGETS